MFKEFFRPAPEPEKKDTKKSEHLKEGVNPIIACVGTEEQFKATRSGPAAGRTFREILLGEPSRENPEYYGLSNSRKNRNANYYESPENLHEENFKNPEWNSYVISPIDDVDKLSNQFANCTGVVVAGRDKETKRNISFLSHEDPHYFLKKKSLFIADFEERLEELKARSEEGTVDAVIFGGNSLEKDSDYKKAYLDSIELLAEEIEGVFGFQPVVITGPKTIARLDNAYYDNENRRLFIERPEVGDATTESYLPSEIKEQSKKW